MLLELHIRDFAIIDQLTLKFGPGFTAFTGETGAGKSIIVDAVELMLGGRADSTVVRTGAETAIIEGTFRIQAPIQEEVHSILRREGMLDDQEYLVLGREVRSQGRNVARVNGRTASVALLRELGQRLVDVHGQSEHLSLLRVPEHLHLLDRFAQVEAALSNYGDTYAELGRVRSELKALRRQEQDAARRAEFLIFQIDEVEAARLRPGEDEALREERVRLANAEQLATLAELAVAALDQGIRGETSASDLFGRAVEALKDLAEIDPSMAEVRLEGQALMEQMSGLSRRLRIYREDVEHNPTRLDEVEERIDLIRSLQRKYGGSIEEVIASAEHARRELGGITHAEERLEALSVEEGRLLARLGEAGGQLSQARRAAGGDLVEAIERELKDLRMAEARFDVQLEWEEDPSGAPVDGKSVAFSPTGLDQVEFLVAPNPGEGLKPLVKIASGGETSRLMLGLKTVLAQADKTPTLIFDEIDQGIGGRVGSIVGRKLWGLAGAHQVLCVTHLPQLAAYADQHFKVDKAVEEGRTMAQVQPLGSGRRTTELAQMLGGDNQPNLDSAAELLRRAEDEKAAVSAR